MAELLVALAAERVTLAREGARPTFAAELLRPELAGRAAEPLRYDALRDAPPRAEKAPSLWPPRAIVLELEGVKRLPPP